MSPSVVHSPTVTVDRAVPCGRRRGRVEDDLRRGVVTLANGLATRLDDLFDEARQLPRWRPAPVRRRVIVRLIGYARKYLDEFCEAFDI